MYTVSASDQTSGTPSQVISMLSLQVHSIHRLEVVLNLPESPPGSFTLSSADLKNRIMQINWLWRCLEGQFGIALGDALHIDQRLYTRCLIPNFPGVVSFHSDPNQVAAVLSPMPNCERPVVFAGGFPIVSGCSSSS